MLDPPKSLFLNERTVAFRLGVHGVPTCPGKCEQKDVIVVSNTAFAGVVGVDEQRAAIHMRHYRSNSRAKMRDACVN